MKSCDMEGISCWRGICQLRLWSVGRHGKTNFHTIPAHLFAHKTLVTSCHYDFEKPLPFLQPLTLDQFFLHPPTRSAPFLLIEKLWNFIISIFLLVVAARLLSMIVIAFYVVPFITRSERGVLFWVDGIPICCFYLRPRSWRFFFYVDGAVIFLLKKMPFLFGSCASTDAGFSCSARRYWSPFKLINFKCDF